MEGGNKILTASFEQGYYQYGSPFSHSGDPMVITAAHLHPILALVFGVLILIFPRLLNYLVAGYLILTGLIGLGIFAIR